MSIRRYLSFLWPQAGTSFEGQNGPLHVRWEAGHKVLNSDFGNQSFGALHRVWQRTFAHLDLRDRPPGSVLLLGLGAGSVPAILREELGCQAPITTVELDPVMVQLARSEFGLDRHAQLTVKMGDATVQVHAMRKRFDLVLVDLFADLDLARGVDSRAFVHGLRDCCDHGGMVCFNTVAYDAASNARCQAVHDHLAGVFSTVHELRLEGMNRMFIAS